LRRGWIRGRGSVVANAHIDASDGDVLWAGYGRVSVGSDLSDSISCQGAAVVSEALYDIPDTPASYSGVMSGSSRSTLYFNAVGAGNPGLSGDRSRAPGHAAAVGAARGHIAARWLLVVARAD
jgi:hypothetical protein